MSMFFKGVIQQMSVIFINEFFATSTVISLRKGTASGVFNEVHGYGVPRTFRNRKLLERTVRLVLAGLRASASDAQFDKCNHVIVHLWPVVVMTEES
jgi:hypothetical protein